MNFFYSKGNIEVNVKSKILKLWKDTEASFVTLGWIKQIINWKIRPIKIKTSCSSIDTVRRMKDKPKIWKALILCLIKDLYPQYLKIFYKRGYMFSDKVKVKVKLLSRVLLFVTAWTVACTSLLRPWDFLGQCTGVGCHFLLQGIFQTQGSNPGLPHCRQMLYHLSHQGSP